MSQKEKHKSVEVKKTTTAELDWTTATGFKFLALPAYAGAAFYVGVAADGALYRSLAKSDIDRPASCMDMFLTTPLVGQITEGVAL
ncbi:hypothetical protein GGX14DRAFT_568271 [Mycena pura]|uniref:Uncharacterized protein n=1 Tax=Mycena pura TaxID=153505 RepID=A0AAD6YEW9_9AGAR|nr:hypothetical protein GGX14DRAFT_568271 [Mycena pura]